MLWKIAKRTNNDLDGVLECTTKQLLWAFNNRFAIRKVADTVDSAQVLIENIEKRSEHAAVFQKALVHYTNLVAHMLILDGALDRYFPDRLF